MCKALVSKKRNEENQPHIGNTVVALSIEQNNFTVDKKRTASALRTYSSAREIYTAVPSKRRQIPRLEKSSLRSRHDEIL